MKIFYISIALTTISIVYLSYVQKIEINASLTSQKLNSNIKEKKRFKIEQNRSIEANDCNNEWLILNSNVYLFRFYETVIKIGCQRGWVVQTHRFERQFCDRDANVYFVRDILCFFG